MADDEDITLLDTRATNDPPLTLQGPITRARTHRLNHEMNSLLAVHTTNSKDEMLLISFDLLMLRNMGEAGA